MSDGTTGIQVAPIPTENEMASIRQIFTNVANALVRASELATQVTDLETRFNSLNQEFTAVMSRNDELLTSLNEVRLQRDDAQSKLVEVKAELEHTTGKLMIEQDANGALNNKVAKLEADIRHLKDELTDAISHWDKADNRATQAEANLAKVKSALGIVDPPKSDLAPQAKPIPQPSPTEVGQEAAHTYPSDAGPARPLTEPELTTPKYEWDPNKF